MAHTSYEDARRESDRINEEAWREECQISGHPVSDGCTVYQTGDHEFYVGPHGDSWLGELQWRYLCQKEASAIAVGLTLRITEKDIANAKECSADRYFTPLDCALERVTNGSTHPWWINYRGPIISVGFDDGGEVSLLLSRRLRGYLYRWWNGEAVSPSTFTLKTEVR